MLLRFAFVFAAALAMVMPSQAGGLLLLSVGNPDAVNDPAARGAIATARLTLCHATSVSMHDLQVTAEGWIDGRRVVQKVRVVPVKGSQLLAIHWTRPAGGDWSLRFTAYGKVIKVAIGKDGVRPQSVRMDGPVFASNIAPTALVAKR